MMKLCVKLIMQLEGKEVVSLLKKAAMIMSKSEENLAA